MIHTISGTVQAQKKQQIALSVGPIALELAVADETQFPLAKPATIHTYLGWNQENGPSLYGFKDETDRAVFLMVTSCSGVGPRLGLAVLADLGSSGFITAVQKEDERMLSKVSGIGAKKAEQMIVQLKHKVHQLIDSGVVISESGQAVDWNTMTEALKALNYSRTEISQAIMHVRDKRSSDQESFDQLLRAALSFLSKQA